MKMVKSRHAVHENYSQCIIVEYCPACMWGFLHARTHPLHGVSSCALELVVDTTIVGSCSTCFFSEGEMRDAS